MKGRLHHIALGGIISLLLVLASAGLSAWPRWQSMPDNYALIRLSFTHSGLRKCREYKPDELAALPRNMRQARKCDRHRAPVGVELMLDGKLIYAALLQPSGIAGSGPSRIYKRFAVPAGQHDVAVRLGDDPDAEEFNHEASRQILLVPGQSFVIDFKPEAGGFVFR